MSYSNSNCINKEVTMHKSTKLFSSIALAITLSACGSVAHKRQLSENLIFAPAIDVPYSEVNKNIKDNLGLHVRWGGQVISVENVGDITELTVFGYPLSKDGKPIQSSDKDFNGGRFIVEVKDYNEKSTPRFLTVYGQVTGEKILVNGPKTMTIPILTAIDSKEWNRDPSADRRGIAYYSLGYSTGHFNSFNGYGHRGYWGNSYGYDGHGFRSRNRFNNRASFYVYKRH